MLSEIFRKIWEEQGGGLDQNQLRAKAFSTIPLTDYADALHEALYDSAYKFMLSMRHEKPTNYDEQGSSTVTRRPGGSSAGQGNSRQSNKIRMLRERWPMLACSYPVSHGGARKNLEMMSAEEVRYAASVSRSLADGNRRRAEWLEMISDKQIEHKATVVAKLPASVLDDIAETAP